MEQGEEDAGEDGGEDVGGCGDFVVGVPELAGRWGAGKREPVVGDGYGGEQEAAEEDLFEERCEEDTEEGDQPDIGRGAEEVVHGDVFGDGDDGGDGLHREGEGEA